MRKATGAYPNRPSGVRPWRYSPLKCGGLAVEVPLTRADGVPVDPVVNLDDVTTIPKQLLRDYITSLSNEKMRQVVAAIDFALDLEANR